MKEPAATTRAVLASRIHTAHCPWAYTNECAEDFSSYRRIDAEAIELLEALARRAYRSGLRAQENSNHPQRRHPSHRCPVGDRVADGEFSDTRPKPWTGELYATSSDERTLYRLYFMEGRPDWYEQTTVIVACRIGKKPVAEGGSWTSADQTDDIRGAMNSGIEHCLSRRECWRRWNSP